MSDPIEPTSPPEPTPQEKALAAIHSRLSAKCADFAAAYAEAGRIARELKSHGVDPAADPPALPTQEALPGTLASVSPTDVGGVLTLLGQIGHLLTQPNPFDANQQLGDTLNKLAVAHR